VKFADEIKRLEFLLKEKEDRLEPLFRQNKEADAVIAKALFVSDKVHDQAKDCVPVELVNLDDMIDEYCEKWGESKEEFEEPPSADGVTPDGFEYSIPWTGDECDECGLPWFDGHKCGLPYPDDMEIKLTCSGEAMEPDERGLLLNDMVMTGVCFIKDGKRVPPQEVYKDDIEIQYDEDCPSGEYGSEYSSARQQANSLSNDKEFWEYALSYLHPGLLPTKARAIQVIYNFCKIESRKELTKANPAACERFKRLVDAFEK